MSLRNPVYFNVVNYMYQQYCGSLHLFILSSGTYII